MDERLTKSLLDSMGALGPHPLESVPILGGFVYSFRWQRAAAPVVERVRGILASREPFPLAGWGDDPLVRRVAQATLKALSEEMSWEDDRFRPDDDGAVAFWCWDDGLDASFALVALEDALGLPLLEQEPLLDLDRTLGEFVADLAGRLR